jgi:hypothetical protein
MMGIDSLLELGEAASAQLGIPIDKVFKAWSFFNRATATVRSSPEVRAEAALRIESLFTSNPNIDANDVSRNVAEQFGLKNCQADRAFVRYRWNKLLADHRQDRQAAE